MPCWDCRFSFIGRLTDMNIRLSPVFTWKQQIALCLSECYQCRRQERKTTHQKIRSRPLQAVSLHNEMNTHTHTLLNPSVNEIVNKLLVLLYGRVEEEVLMRLVAMLRPVEKENEGRSMNNTHSVIHFGSCIKRLQGLLLLRLGKKYVQEVGKQLHRKQWISLSWLLFKKYCPVFFYISGMTQTFGMQVLHICEMPGTLGWKWYANVQQSEFAWPNI